ncbi:MAG: hypothetical protein LCH56_01350 [Proteobacteria bacterium]|nr:hypothetical protein [Pseudomonadota bacterium]
MHGLIAMTDQLWMTVGILVVEIALFLACLVQVRKPIDPLKPRMLPYNIIMIFLTVAIFATVAHIISLLTGHQLAPRRGKGMR